MIISVVVLSLDLQDVSDLSRVVKCLEIGLSEVEYVFLFNKTSDIRVDK